jgi:RNA polymerase sigma-70 factor (ECF subfamily)
VEKPSNFPDTRWSVVLRLRSPSEPQRQQAFEDLCRAYWRPLYVFARRCGHLAHDAEDLTQGFFARLVGRDQLPTLSRERGRLRVFFKTAFRNFIVDEVRHKTRQKRGGHADVVSIDLDSAERQFQQLLRDGVSPDDEFDRQWARTILRRTLGTLREKFRARGRLETLRELEIFLGPDEAAPAYVTVAARLGQTENTVAAAVRRMREEFRALLRLEIADTLAEGEDVDEELRYLLRLAW